MVKLLCFCLSVVEGRELLTGEFLFCCLYTEHMGWGGGGDNCAWDRAQCTRHRCCVVAYGKLSKIFRNKKSDYFNCHALSQEKSKQAYLRPRMEFCKHSKALDLDQHFEIVNRKKTQVNSTSGGRAMTTK